MRRLFFILLLALAAATPYASAQAQQQVTCKFTNFLTSFDCVKQLGTSSGVTETDPVQIVLKIMRTILTLTAIAGVIGLIIAGVMYMFAAGEPQKAEKAKKAIIYVIIGLFIIGASIIIVNFIIAAFTGRGQEQPPAAGGERPPKRAPSGPGKPAVPPPGAPLVKPSGP